MTRRPAHPQLVLASASPRRREILRMLGLKYISALPRVSEKSSEKNPRVLVEKLALRKALAAARSPRLRGRDFLVVAADTVVYLRGSIVGKPRGRKDAARILRALSGSRHSVYTGVAIVHARTGERRFSSERSAVKFKKLSRSEINAASASHLDKAGAYAIQEEKDAFVEKIKGDYYNVVGMPVKLLLRMLSPFGIKRGLSPSGRGFHVNRAKKPLS